LHPHVCVPFQKIHSQSLHKFFCLTIFHFASNIVNACKRLGCHILALELDMEVFTEVLEPFIEVVTPQPNVEHVHSFDIDYSVKKCSMRLLDCE
jgi:predicted subunit of tRNA(5-methylaminomethyl-2-thiouridylate) methyltransferase